MKNLGLIFALCMAIFVSISAPEPRLGKLQSIKSPQALRDICVPEAGPICVCRTCVYNDDGTCSCPAES